MTYKELIHSVIILMEIAKQKLTIKTNFKRDQLIDIENEIARITINPLSDESVRSRLIINRNIIYNDLKRLEGKLLKINEIIRQIYMI